MAMEVNRFDVFLVSLDPTVGHEIKKARPCAVISPDEMNHHIGTVMVAPMTTKGRDYPTQHLLIRARNVSDGSQRWQSSKKMAGDARRLALLIVTFCRHPRVTPWLPAASRSGAVSDEMKLIAEA